MKNLDELPAAHPHETLLYHPTETSSYLVIEKPIKTQDYDVLLYSAQLDKHRASKIAQLGKRMATKPFLILSSWDYDSLRLKKKKTSCASRLLSFIHGSHVSP